MRYYCNCKHCGNKIPLPKNISVRNHVTVDNNLHFRLNCKRCKNNDIYYQQDIMAREGKYIKQLFYLILILPIVAFFSAYIDITFAAVIFYITVFLIVVCLFSYLIEINIAIRFNESEWVLESHINEDNLTTMNTEERFDAITCTNQMYELKKYVACKIPNCETKYFVMNKNENLKYLSDESQDFLSQYCETISHNVEFRKENLICTIELSHYSLYGLHLFDKDSQKIIMFTEINCYNYKDILPYLDKYIDMVDNCSYKIIV